MVAAFALMMISCKSEYDKLVRSELSTGVIHEDLYFGLKLGQTQKKFYEICWELNKNQKISQGPYNQMVKYIMSPGEIPNDTSKVEMLFYGDFDEDKIMRGMNHKFSYLNWAPWNEDAHADQLALKLQDYYMQQYGGNEFITIDLGISDEYQSYVKVDGNRQILIYPQNKKDVVVKISDNRYRIGKDAEENES